MYDEIISLLCRAAGLAAGLAAENCLHARATGKGASADAEMYLGWEADIARALSRIRADLGYPATSEKLLAEVKRWVTEVSREEHLAEALVVLAAPGVVEYLTVEEAYNFLHATPESSVFGVYIPSTDEEWNFTLGRLIKRN